MILNFSLLLLPKCEHNTGSFRVSFSGSQSSPRFSAVSSSSGGGNSFLNIMIYLETRGINNIPVNCVICKKLTSRILLFRKHGRSNQQCLPRRACNVKLLEILPNIQNTKQWDDLMDKWPWLQGVDVSRTKPQSLGSADPKLTGNGILGQITVWVTIRCGDYDWDEGERHLCCSERLNTSFLGP